MALATSFTWLLVFRAIQGIGFSAVIPLTIVLIGDLLDGDEEIAGQGLKVFLDRIGYMILPPLGGLLAAFAWYWPFTLYIITVPLGIMTFFWMPETKGSVTSGTRAYLGEMLKLTRHPRLVVAFSAGFLRFFLDYGFLTYFPLFLVRTHGISTATAGLLYVFFSAGAMITSSQAGRLAAGRDKARILFIAFLISGIALVAVPFMPGVWLVGGASVLLWHRQRCHLADAKESAHAECAASNARRYRVFRPLDPTGFKNYFDLCGRLALGYRRAADNFLDARIAFLISVALMALLLPSRKSALASPSVS